MVNSSWVAFNHSWSWPWIGSYSIPTTVVHQSSTSVYIPNFIEIRKTLWTDIQTYLLMDISPPLMLLGRLTKRPFNGLIYRTTWAKRHQKGEKVKTILDFNEARNDGVVVASAWPYAPCSRQITTIIFKAKKKLSIVFVELNQKCIILAIQQTPLFTCSVRTMIKITVHRCY